MFHDGATVQGTGKAIGRATVRRLAKCNRSVGATPPGRTQLPRQQMSDMIHSVRNETHRPYASGCAKYHWRRITAKSL